MLSNAPTMTQQPIPNLYKCVVNHRSMRSEISLMLLKCYQNVITKAPNKQQRGDAPLGIEEREIKCGSLCESSSLSTPTKAILAQISNVEKFSKVDFAFLPRTSAYRSRIPGIDPC
jgi:hypothetical protein